MAKKKFKTEVDQLLNLLIHSLYSHNEIFLRELISNASDALDKLKYLALTDENLKKIDFTPRIDIRINGAGENTLVVEDNGIGMNEDELNTSLGTIARSGTKKFLESLSDEAKKDSNVIGKFGVGFYSSFMVSEKVEVISCKAGQEETWKWVSDGRTGYTVEKTDNRGSQGTSVTLHLNETGRQYSSQWDIKPIIQKYSDHIAFPIHVHWVEGEKNEAKTEQVNSANALWKRSKSQIKQDEYNEFYKSLSHDTEDPMLMLHTQAEGTIEYTTLFFVPKKAPMDMYQANFAPGVKLYVKRVFITDDDKELMPVWLRFVRGVIDSEDLPLNVSREILQKNRVLANIRDASVKKLLAEFKKLAADDKAYEDFINQYNRPLKEGIYTDWAHRDELLELIRYKSTVADGWTSLESYRKRMPEDQKSIYYITGDSEEVLRKSPLLAAYQKKGYEILIMDDEVDEIITPIIGKYDEKPLNAINRTGAMDDLKTEDDKKKEEQAKPVLDKIKKVLGDAVKDVVASSRLSDAPSCLVSDDADPSVQMRQMLKAMGQQDIPDAVFILEINLDHPVIQKLTDCDDKQLIDDAAHLLYEQALLVEGVSLTDPNALAARINRLMAKAF